MSCLKAESYETASDTPLLKSEEVYIERESPKKLRFLPSSAVYKNLLSELLSLSVHVTMKSYHIW